MTHKVQANRYLQMAIAVVVAVAVLAAVAMSTAMSVRSADADHGRSNQLSWHRLDADTAEFHSEVRYNTATLGAVVVGQTINVAVNFGDGTQLDVAHEVQSINATPDVVVTAAHFTHQFSGPGPFTVTASMCCRVSGPTHVSNADLAVVVSTKVDLAAANGSPTTSAADVVDCALAALCTFMVPAVDPDAGVLRFRLATATEAGHASFVQPPAAIINPETGSYSWNTAGVALNALGGPTLYSTQVIIERLSIENVVLTHTAVDFLIRLPAPATSPPANAAPAFLPPTPAADAVILNSLPNQVSFTLAASDPDGDDTVTLAVSGAPDGAVVTSTPGNPASATFTWTPTLEGNYFLTLTATDQAGLAASQRLVEIRVLPAPANGPPRVNADVRSDVNVHGVINLPLLLSGEVVDPNPTDVLTIGWDNNSTPCSFSDPAMLNPYVTCSQTGTFRMTLTASDGIAPAVHDDINVVIGANNPPAVTAGADISGLTGQSVIVNGFVSDANFPADTVVIGWTASDLGCSFAKPAVQTTTVVCTVPGAHQLTLTANDGVNPAVAKTITFTVTQANRVPVVDAGPDTSGLVGAAIALNGTATDPDGDALVVTWITDPSVPGGVVPGCAFADASAVATTVTCSDPGTFTLRLSAGDGTGVPVTDTLTVVVAAPNVAPLVTIAAPAPGFVNEPVSLQGRVSDANPADALTLTWSQVLAPGSSVACTFTDAAAAVTTVTCASAGIFSLRLTADDGVNPPVWETVFLTISARPVDPDPDPTRSVNAGVDVAGHSLRPVLLDGSVTGPGTVRWTSSSGRCRFFNRTSVDTRVICSRTGTFTLTLTLSDGVNPPITDTVVVTITRRPRMAPIVNRLLDTLTGGKEA